MLIPTTLIWHRKKRWASKGFGTQDDPTNDWLGQANSREDEIGPGSTKELCWSKETWFKVWSGWLSLYKDCLVLLCNEILTEGEVNTFLHWVVWDSGKDCKVAYRLKLPMSMGHIHNMFYVLLLRKCLRDLSQVVWFEDVELEDNLIYKECSIWIMDRQIKTLGHGQIPLVKV